MSDVAFLKHCGNYAWLDIQLMCIYEKDIYIDLYKKYVEDMKILAEESKKNKK